MRKYILLFLVSAGSLSFSLPFSEFSVNIYVKNITNATAPVRVAIYRSTDKFPKENGYYKAFVFTPGKTGEVVFTLNNIAPGDYAFALFQDINSNGKLGTNIFGYPKEPFCFSNNVKPLFSAPDFDECKISVNEKNRNIYVSLIK